MGGSEPGSVQRLAELVASRLCHDLNGPLSIIASAAELARLEAEQGLTGGEAMGLMLEGSQAGAARVRLLRALCGSPVGPLAAEEAGALARGNAGGGRAEIDLSAMAAGTVFDAAAARVFLAALMVAGEGLPRGGRIRCLGRADDFTFAIDGQNAAWPAPLTAVLAGDDPVAVAIAAGPRGLLGPLLVLAARDADLVPSLLMGPGVPLLRLARGG